ncbi:cytochrome P450 2C15-like [Acanthaster planci]|uniref:Cytochrome P450 2C15-like n=1 Tax=Acanthaster planci TaxID=133434 RepID=A0A8B7ZZ95_ACAPL|nr:cytochrome P450 2C15-like [Acanthaster planci]
MGGGIQRMLPVTFMLGFLKKLSRNSHHRRLLQITVLLSLIWAIIKRLKKQRELQANPARGLPLPPGPWGWPIIGIMPTLAHGYPQKIITEMSKTYGSVMSFKLGSHLAVVLNDFDTIKEAFAKSGDKFSDRPKVTMFESIHPAGAGVVLSYYDNHWKENRRFTLRTIKKMGIGKAAMMESKISEEARFVARSFDEQGDRPFHPTYFTNLAVANMINSLVFGKRNDYQDPLFLQAISKMMELFKVFGVGAANFLPNVMKYVPGSQFRQAMKIVKFFEEKWYGPQILQHIETFNANNIRDFIDHYLLEKFFKEGSIHYQDFPAVLGAVGDMFGAGLETTSTALDWVFLCMVKYPEAQAKAQRELDKVVGRYRMPQWGDRHNLHYVMAFLDEALRWSAGGPFGVPHSPIEDTDFRGYFIPKSAVVIANLHAVMYNPEVFPDPETFKPERFLNEDGKFVKHEHVAQFSIGRRACLGEHLARMEIYIIATHILHQFTLTAPGGNTDSIRTDGIIGLTKNPHPYKICSIRRTDTYDITEIPMDLLSDDNNNNKEDRNNNNECKHGAR